MDVFLVAYAAALFVLPIVVYKLLQRPQPAAAPSWYYVVKRCLCRRAIATFMRRTVALPANGPLAPLDAFDEDVLSFHALDLERNAIYVRVAAMAFGVVEVVLRVQLRDGRTLTLPEDGGMMRCSLEERTWRTRFLTVTRQPNGDFRLRFDGFLRDGDGEIAHVGLRLLFARASDALHYPGDFDAGAFGDAACRTRWRDGKWTAALGDQVGESHFGVLHGTVKSRDLHLDDTVFLAGYQSRRFGTADRHECTRGVAMLTLADDGMLLYAEKKRTSYIPSAQVRHGAVLLPNGTTTSISECDLPLPNDYGSLASMTVHMAAGRKQIKCHLAVDAGSAVRCESTLPIGGYNLESKMAAVSFASGRGVASLLFFKGHSKASNAPERKEAVVGDVEEEFILPLLSVKAQNVAQTGGKAHSLSILANLQSSDFSVSQGFVITCAAMDAQLEEHSDAFRPAFARLQLATTTTAMQEACDALETLIASMTWQADVVQAIVDAMEKLDAGCFAVRSSGVGEDTSAASAAGQNATVLGVRSPAALLAAVRTCWASLYSFRSVEYRRQRGLPLQAGMGVVVQAMVNARIAGVLFTCAADGDVSRMRIAAAYGLGESIVSGAVGGDEVFMRRMWSGDVAVERLQVGAKHTKLVLDDDKGTQVVHLSDAHARTACICVEEAIALARVAVRLETHYERMLDIEWAFDGERIVLLQARPVTFLDEWSDYELEHEFDVPVLCNQNVYTTANVKEVIPGAVTPLTNSTVLHAVDRSAAVCVTASWERDFAGTRKRHIVCAQHHIFIDFLGVLLKTPPDAIDRTVRAIDLCVCGRPVTTPAMLRRAIAIHGRTSIAQRLRSICDMLRCFWYAESVVEVVERRRPPSCKASGDVEEMVACIDARLRVFADVIVAHSTASRASSCYQMLALNFLAGDDLTPATLAQVALLLSNGGAGVVSAEVPADLEAIAAVIRSSPLRSDFIECASHEAHVQLGKMPEAAGMFQRFLQRHGHRSGREFELMEESWAENPTMLAVMLQALARLDASTKHATHLSVDEVVAQLDSRLNKRFLRFLVSRCRAGVATRERSKSEVVHHVHGLRGAFAHLGERLHELHILPTTDLLYFLTYEEVKCLIKQPDPLLITKAMRRKRLYATWNAYTFPELSTGRPQRLTALVEDDDDQVATSLTGTPVCGGRVTARCCCVESLRDIGALRSGDVLVTHATDVAWTPYFPLVAGVATELGGLISHGAVVAREYGLPCLVGVAGALRTFRTGEHVVLDATAGRIYRRH